MNVILTRINSETDIVLLASLADEIWREHYLSILTKDQIDYMIDKFQSADAMTHQIINQGYEYYFITVCGEEIGYTGICKDVDKLFLSKLYIKKEFRGNRYASEVFKQLQQICVNRRLKAIWLTVNRYNEESVAIYKKMGFKVIRTRVADIGQGYVMDDFIMEFVL